jgi:Ran GTPase-activating protein (RanGAP) involved in mRNA processing and transport
LSKNEIGDVAADALANYLKREDCPLQKLVMQTADVDDFEAEAFLSAVMENRSLTELDLSSNLIGGAENLNTVYPDLITGSEALADLLRIEGIKLKTLKLVWNMIRLDGAVDFCSSLAINETLTYLDLSYNSLAQDGGIMLGMSIEDNHALETLIIANNAIDAIACFTICVGIISNLTLKKVVFDGNPIAEQGARALMLVPMHAGGRVELSAAKCNVTMKDPRCWFDFTAPCRAYDLDLSDGFERAVVKVCVFIR